MTIRASFILFFLISFNAYSQSCEQIRQDDDTYYISYLDSGIGGAIFAVESLNKITQDLRDYEKKYAVKFEIEHYGDTANAPYGEKSKQEISDLTFKMSDYVLSKPHHKTNILACNTASANLTNHHAKILREKYRDSGFITMVETSVNAIAKESNQGDVIAVFATPATIKSNIYQNALEPNFSVVVMNPKNWVKNIETSQSDEQIKQDFNLEMTAFLEKYGDQKIKQIKSIGLFCTHYPYFRKDISEYFSNRGNKTVKIFSQGELFSHDILSDVNKRLATSFKKRKNALPKECQSTKSFVIKSHISGNDSNALIKAMNKIYGPKTKIDVHKNENFTTKPKDENCDHSNNCKIKIPLVQDNILKAS